MTQRRRLAAAAVGVLALVVVAASLVASRAGVVPRWFHGGPGRQTLEAAYRANNVGVALLEQFNYQGAADAFQEALRRDPTLALARINLAIALLYAQDLDGATREAERVAREMPRDPRPPYILGLAARQRGDVGRAREEFDRVLSLDPEDLGVQVNVGQLLIQQQHYAEAIPHFRAALAVEPYNVTASYNLGLAMTRAGDREAGQKEMERSQALRTSGYGTSFSAAYLEQGRYAEAQASTGAERDLVDPAVPDVAFVPEPIKGSAPNPARAQAPLSPQAGSAGRSDRGRGIADTLGGGIALLDFDGDGDLDVVVVSPSGFELLRNDGGTFVDVTTGSGLDTVPPTGATGCVAGDYDNDGRADLLILRYGGNLLLHNDGGGHFSDATVRSRLPRYSYLSISAAFVDFDHDGDLDIVVAGLADATRASSDAVSPDDLPGAPIQFVRNNGDGTFTDITPQTTVTGLFHAVTVVATDYDNRRDVDLLVARSDGPPLLLKNLRNGTFKDVATSVGLQIDGQVTSVAVADFNKDDFPDFFFGRRSGPGLFAISDGRGRFKTTAAPPGSAGAVSAQFFDYDNDGLLDLLTWSPDGPRLFRQIADGWSDVSPRAFPSPTREAGTIESARGLGAADFDGDGDTDLLQFDGKRDVVLWQNDGGNRHTSLRVAIKGRVSNRSGIGAKVEVRAGSLRQRVETSASTPAAAPADIVFGLGARPGVDTLRVLWPSGVLQAETGPAPKTGTDRPPLVSRIAVEELDRKPSSCPFLYTWNGRGFEFVTDFMGGGEMGYWEAPGIRNRPDPVEYVRIRGDQLQPKDGRYELRVTNELEEAVFVDRLQLLAIAHPSDISVYPNEGMVDPPKPFRLYAVRDPHSPAMVLDDHGHNVTERIARLDREYPDDFRLMPIRGYAEPHALRFPLDPTPPDVLLLTGWTDYAFSSDNVAANQAGLVMQTPTLEAKDRSGTWRRVADDIGIPVGRPQTLVVDLRHRLPAGASELRLVTNMRIYWDQILFATAASSDQLRIERMDPAKATLRARGFSAEQPSIAPQAIGYDYERVTSISPWKAMTGWYTREGDVTALLTNTDDRFVVGAPGDEIALAFDAMKLAAIPAGWARTFLLYADGFSKEMDVNSASPDTVAPLPFHGMSRYPYPAPEHYPDGPEYERYRAEYNTRRIMSPIPSIDAIAAQRSAPR